MPSKSQQKRIAALKDSPPVVATVREGVEMRSRCVWCNKWLQDITSVACLAPDGDGHLFRLDPYTGKSGLNVREE